MNSHGLHELVLRAKAGDRTARGELISRTQSLLHAYSLKLLGENWDHRSSSDLVNSTWERALRRLGDFKGGTDDESTRRALVAWLQTIMRSILLNLVRDQKPARPVVSLDVRRTDDSAATTPEPAADDETPSFSMKQADTRQAIQAALASLPELTRQVIELRLLKELPMAEIAQQVDRDEKTVRKYFHQGLEQLRRRLENEV